MAVESGGIFKTCSQFERLHFAEAEYRPDGPYILC